MKHEEWLDLARILARRSICRKMKFGCVILDDHGFVTGLGYNQPLRPEQCCLREGVPSGTCLERCWAIHAEQAALIDALPHRRRLRYAYVAGYHGDGTVWQSNGFYCTACARFLYFGGVQYIVVPGSEGPRILSIAEAIDSAYAVALGERRA